LKIFPKIVFSKEDITSILELLRYDKKNSHGKINFILIEDISKPLYDIQVNEDLIKKSFKYYLS
jgi:3-dehydroquinate synthase